MVEIGEGQSTSFQIQVENISDPAAPATLDYTVRALDGGCCDGEDPSTALELNGQPAGTPVTGSLMVGPGQTRGVSVDVEYPTAWLIGYERLAVYGDDDGDGMDEKLGEIAVRAIPSSLVDVPGEPPATDGGVDDSRLFVAVPNPFGPSGQIRFRLTGTAPAPVKLRLYDIGGRVVRVFLAGRVLDPGEHGVPWDAVDERGTKLGTGMYFLKLEVGPRTETVKVVVRR
jgi:hypothetical protein